MPRRVSAALLVCAAMRALGCGSPEFVTEDLELAGRGGQEAAPRSEPNEETLCRIVFGESTRAEVEAILGKARRTQTSESTTLLYQYSTGLTLSLLFRDGRFTDASVYNGAYPSCWAEQERARDAEVNRSIDETLQDAGVSTRDGGIRD